MSTPSMLLGNCVARRATRCQHFTGPLCCNPAYRKLLHISVWGLLAELAQEQILPNDLYWSSNFWHDLCPSQLAWPKRVLETIFERVDRQGSCRLSQVSLCYPGGCPVRHQDCRHAAWACADNLQRLASHHLGSKLLSMLCDPSV